MTSSLTAAGKSLFDWPALDRDLAPLLWFEKGDPIVGEWGTPTTREIRMIFPAWGVRRWIPCKVSFWYDGVEQFWPIDGRIPLGDIQPRDLYTITIGLDR
jgi:hypothetical protein